MDDDTMKQDGTREDAEEERVRNALRDHFPSASFPGAEIEERIRSAVERAGPERPSAAANRAGRVEFLAPSTPRWRGPIARTALAVAASLVVFVAGAEYGRRTATAGAPAMARAAAPATAASGPAASTKPGTSTGGTFAAPDAALSLQDAGTRYIASLARFSGSTRSLSARERQVAREVVLATIYGATLELLRESADDATLREVADILATRREQIGNDTIAVGGSS